MPFYEAVDSIKARELGAAFVIPRHIEIEVFSGWYGARTTTTGDEAFVAISPADDGSALLVVPKSRFSMGSTGETSFGPRRPGEGTG